MNILSSRHYGTASRSTWCNTSVNWPLNHPLAPPRCGCAATYALSLDGIRALPPKADLNLAGPGVRNHGRPSLGGVEGTGPHPANPRCASGHQCLAQVFGGRVCGAEFEMHGKALAGAAMAAKGCSRGLPSPPHRQPANHSRSPSATAAACLEDPTAGLGDGTIHGPAAPPHRHLQGRAVPTPEVCSPGGQNRLWPNFLAHSRRSRSPERCAEIPWIALAEFAPLQARPGRHRHGSATNAFGSPGQPPSGRPAAGSPRLSPCGQPRPVA